MDWNRRIICQKETKEQLQCPARSTRKVPGAGYASFTKNVKEFNDLRALPMRLVISSLDEGSGIEATLVNHRALWHKSRRDLFNDTKLDRALKRGRQDDVGYKSPIKTRRSVDLFTGSCTNSTCFFCDKTDYMKNLHEVKTLELDQKVRDLAQRLNNNKLLTKL